MDKKHFTQAVQLLKSSAEKKAFTQSIDIIINLKNIDLKKEDQKVNTFLTLPYPLGKQITTTALVGNELSTKAKAVCNHVILVDQFKTLDKKAIKKLAESTDFFIAQATIMPQIAATFGKILGPRGLMPNPKAGCVLPPTGEVKPIVDRLQKTVKLETKNEPVVKTAVGVELSKEEELVENAFFIYNTILHALPQEKNNIKSVLLKLTMGKPIVVSEEGAHIKVHEPKKKPEQKQALSSTAAVQQPASEVTVTPTAEKEKQSLKEKKKEKSSSSKAKKPKKEAKSEVEK